MVEPGDALKVFDTAFGRVAIAICYDIEFPLYARAQCEAGARLLLVPSCTDTAAGANRVRYGCQARAMENQAYVACAVTAGEADWSPALDVNTGRAGVYTPVDRGFPDDGVAALDDGEWAIAELDRDRLEAARGDARSASAPTGRSSSAPAWCVRWWSRSDRARRGAGVAFIDDRRRRGAPAGVLGTAIGPSSTVPCGSGDQASSRHFQ